jgi:hypothetical protein
MLVVMAALMWAYLWKYAQVSREPLEPVTTVSGEPPAPIVPDESEAFEGVKDKSPLSFRDMAAYAELIKRARDATPQALDAASRRDVFLTHLADRPAHYRGVPIHLIGTVRRVLRYESKLGRQGWLYEAWIFTSDGQNHPYVGVFEDPPADLPIGLDLSERVIFNGYFLKLMTTYRADGKWWNAPLLIGRIRWLPDTSTTNGPHRSATFWALVVIGVLFLISLGRWVIQLHRLLTRQRTDEAVTSARPHEEISPEALSGYLESLAEEGSEPDGGGSESSSLRL